MALLGPAPSRGKTMLAVVLSVERVVAFGPAHLAYDVQCGETAVSKASLHVPSLRCRLRGCRGSFVGNRFLARAIRRHKSYTETKIEVAVNVSSTDPESVIVNDRLQCRQWA